MKQTLLICLLPVCAGILWAQSFTISDPAWMAQQKSAGSGGHPATPVPIQSGLVMDLPLRYDFVDTGTHSITNNPINGPTFTTVAGVPCCQFVASSVQYVNFGYQSILSLTASNAYTIQAWFYTTQPTKQKTSIFGNFFVSTLQYTLGWDWSGTGVGLYTGSYNGSWHQATSPSSVVVSNVWINVAGTFDGTTFTTYTNGVVAQTTVGAYSLPANTTQPYWMAMRHDAANAADALNGNLHDVLIYGRALSISEVLTNILLTQ